MVTKPDTTNLPLVHNKIKNSFTVDGQKEKNVLNLVSASDKQID